MDEAKTLIHMSVSAIIASVFLALAVGTIGIGYILWGYFSRQENAASAMSSYVNFTAYDNSTVRGQEVVQLIEANEDIFVIIFDGVGSDADNLAIGTKAASWVKVGGYAATIPPNTIMNTVNSLPTYNNALSKMHNFTNIENGVAVDLSVYNLVGKDYTYLQAFMLDQFGTSSKNYAAFRSCLVYDDNSADVIGVLLVRIPEGVTP